MKFLVQSSSWGGYKGLIELCCMPLGGGGAGGWPGLPCSRCIHRARWVAKSMYCIEMYLFFDQASLTGRKANCVRCAAVFVSLIWRRAVVVRWARKSSLNFLEALRIYPDHPTVALYSATSGISIRGTNRPRLRQENRAGFKREMAQIWRLRGRRAA